MGELIMLITQLERNTKWGRIKHCGREKKALEKKKSMFFRKIWNIKAQEERIENVTAGRY